MFCQLGGLCDDTLGLLVLLYTKSAGRDAMGKELVMMNEWEMLLYYREKE